MSFLSTMIPSVLPRYLHCEHSVDSIWLLYFRDANFNSGKFFPRTYYICVMYNLLFYFRGPFDYLVIECIQASFCTLGVTIRSELNIDHSNMHTLTLLDMNEFLPILHVHSKIRRNLDTRMHFRKKMLSYMCSTHLKKIKMFYTNVHNIPDLRRPQNVSWNQMCGYFIKLIYIYRYRVYLWTGTVRGNKIGPSPFFNRSQNQQSVKFVRSYRSYGPTHQMTKHTYTIRYIF